jgi:vacuolar protein sorting-associated protein 13D
VHGTLSKLEAVLDLQQYKLIRGFLSYNLGEPIDDVYVTELYLPNSTLTLNTDVDLLDEVWKNLSITLHLQNVSVGLQTTNEDGSVENSLACINFVKSKLIVDCFSDGAQDVDLVSQEIRVNDTRTFDGRAGEIKNVFPNILRPIGSDSENDVVQAEVHSRRRKEMSKFTILLNNMRLMAILDWLEVVKEFIFQMEEQPKIVSENGISQVRYYI